MFKHVPKEAMDELMARLSTMSIKDTDFDLAEDADPNSCVVIVQDGVNKKISLRDLKAGLNNIQATEYKAGAGIEIDKNNVISVKLAAGETNLKVTTDGLAYIGKTGGSTGGDSGSTGGGTDEKPIEYKQVKILVTNSSDKEVLFRMYYMSGSTEITSSIRLDSVQTISSSASTITLVGDFSDDGNDDNDTSLPIDISDLYRYSTRTAYGDYELHYTEGILNIYYAPKNTKVVYLKFNEPTVTKKWNTVSMNSYKVALVRNGVVIKDNMQTTDYPFTVKHTIGNVDSFIVRPYSTYPTEDPKVNNSFFCDYVYDTQGKSYTVGSTVSISPALSQKTAPKITRNGIEITELEIPASGGKYELEISDPDLMLWGLSLRNSVFGFGIKINDGTALPVSGQKTTPFTIEGEIVNYPNDREIVLDFETKYLSAAAIRWQTLTIRKNAYYPHYCLTKDPLSMEGYKETIEFDANGGSVTFKVRDRHLIGWRMRTSVIGDGADLVRINGQKVITGGTTVDTEVTITAGRNTSGNKSVTRIYLENPNNPDMTYDLVSVRCTETGGSSSNPYLSETELTASYKGETQEITINNPSNMDWTISGDTGLLFDGQSELIGDKTQKTQTITVTIPANPTLTSRKLGIILTDTDGKQQYSTATIIQSKGETPYLSLEGTGTIGSKGGSKHFKVVAPANVSWTLESTVGSTCSPDSGTGSANISLIIDENNKTESVAHTVRLTPTVQGADWDTLTITQAAAIAPKVLFNGEELKDSKLPILVSGTATITISNPENRAWQLDASDFYGNIKFGTPGVEKTELSTADDVDVLVSVVGDVSQMYFDLIGDKVIWQTINFECLEAADPSITEETLDMEKNPEGLIHIVDEENAGWLLLSNPALSFKVGDDSLNGYTTQYGSKTVTVLRANETAMQKTFVLSLKKGGSTGAVVDSCTVTQAAADIPYVKYNGSKITSLIVPQEGGTYNLTVVSPDRINWVFGANTAGTGITFDGEQEVNYDVEGTEQQVVVVIPANDTEETINRYLYLGNSAYSDDFSSIEITQAGIEDPTGGLYLEQSTLNMGVAKTATLNVKDPKNVGWCLIGPYIVSGTSTVGTLTRTGDQTVTIQRYNNTNKPVTYSYTLHKGSASGDIVGTCSVTQEADILPYVTYNGDKITTLTIPTEGGEYTFVVNNPSEMVWSMSGPGKDKVTFNGTTYVDWDESSHEQEVTVLFTENTTTSERVITISVDPDTADDPYCTVVVTQRAAATPRLAPQEVSVSGSGGSATLTISNEDGVGFKVVGGIPVE